MKENLALDLRVSRRRSGLSGKDLAHLLGCTQERISKLENGRARISEDELLTLSLIYSNITSWPERLLQAIVPSLKERLLDMPNEPTNWSYGHTLRLETLDGLSQRLQSLSTKPHEA